jgi:hypothetical protein
MKVWRSVALAAVACAILFPAGAAAQQLTITSPGQGTVIAPGQTLVVTVSVTGSVLGVLVSAQDIGATGIQATAPYTFSLIIPQTIVGLKSLTAFGLTAPEQAVTSAPVQIDVEPSAQATSFTPSLQQIQFGFAGDQFPLGVTATFADGTKLDVTQSTQIMFSSMDTTVATVDSTGLVTATGAGTTSISIKYGARSASVQVTVPPKVVGDLNGDGKVTADDMRILQAFAGTNAVGPFDARDLNGDGIIDARDVQVLQNMCGPACSSIVSITVTLLASSANPSVLGQSIALTATVSPAGTTTPTGSIVFLDGAAQIGTVNLDGSGNAVFQTATLATGAHAITANYGGDTNSTSSRSASLAQLVSAPVALKATTTALAASLNTEIAGQSVTFAATVTSPAGGTSTGTVTFFDGTTSLGTGGLNASGVATYATTALAVGSRSITASYGGDSNYANSTSTALTETVNVAGFAPVSGVPPITAGQTATINLTLYAASGSGLNFMLGCAGTPSKSSCSFNSNPVAPGPPPNGTTVLLTFSTENSELPTNPSNRSPWPWSFTGISAILAALFAVAMTMAGRAPRWRTAFSICLTIAALATLLAGCANNNSYTGTPKGAATFTVTGTSGNTTISTAVTITVQ